MEAKSKFAALAARQGLSESALLALLVEQVLVANPLTDAIDVNEVRGDERAVCDRLTLRLRPGDRALIDARATARRMKTSSYLSMLIHAHAREAPVMPPAELEELKVVAGQVAALRRELRLASAVASASGGSSRAPDTLLSDAVHVVENVRETVAAVVRSNLKSWEGRHD